MFSDFIMLYLVAICKVIKVVLVTCVHVLTILVDFRPLWICSRARTRFVAVDGLFCASLPVCSSLLFMMTILPFFVGFICLFYRSFFKGGCLFFRWNLTIKKPNLNNYFDFHVCLSFRACVRLSVRPPSVRPKNNSNSCSSITKCH